jgi:hypothetical protein
MAEENEENINGGGGGNEENTTDFSELRKKLHPGSSGASKQEPAAAPSAPGAGNERGEEVGGSGSEELKGDGDEDVPVYLLDEEPQGESNWVKWALFHGVSEEDLIAQGKNPNTVRICAQELEKDGYRTRPKKTAKGPGTAVQKSSARGVRVLAGGNPPEALIESISFPMDGAMAKTFENGFKAGATMLVLAVRVMQELTAAGVQQAKPIIDMARSMREGETAAAKTAANDAAAESAARVGSFFGPQISSLQGAISDLKAGGKGETDPINAMIVRTMEPMFQQMMKTFMPNAQFGRGQQGGWTVEEEKPNPNQLSSPQT